MSAVVQATRLNKTLARMRKRLIAQVFYDMGMIEKYGSVTGRLMSSRLMVAFSSETGAVLARVTVFGDGGMEFLQENGRYFKCGLMMAPMVWAKELRWGSMRWSIRVLSSWL
jgi:hypothetical protein